MSPKNPNPPKPQEPEQPPLEAPPVDVTLSTVLETPGVNTGDSFTIEFLRMSPGRDVAGKPSTEDLEDLLAHFRMEPEHVASWRGKPEEELPAPRRLKGSCRLITPMRQRQPLLFPTRRLGLGCKVPEVAAFYRVTERAVWKWIEKGAVQVERTPGGGVRIIDEKVTEALNGSENY